MPEFGDIEDLFVLFDRSRTKVFDNIVVNAIQLVDNDEFLPQRVFYLCFGVDEED
jgi:hypothetical protein